jgi:hypothetical protein
MIERKALLILSLIAGILILSGCLSQPQFENRTRNASVSDPIITPVVTPIQIQCPVQKNEIPWIIINPVSDHYVGEVFDINGTTSLGAGENISIDIIQSYFSPKGQDYFTGFHRNSEIIEGDCGVNRWTILVNLSEFIPFEYFVYVSDPNQMINCSAVFKVF